ncbi:16S rRNA (cytosine(1402)-N(4))-methyltransferase RsmH [Deferribacterales bacterium RsTz2092]|nr:ribosomal RNA small subunit methyltransferase H [Deferribacterales bacterium]
MHIPVLKQELISYLDVRPDGCYLDCTGGGGGHASAVLEKLTTGELVIIDRDPDAVVRLKERFNADSKVTIIHGNFADTREILDGLNISAVDGLYADFGVSSFQLNDVSRGFSFRIDGRIDMRMDNSTGESALDVVNKYSEEQLQEIIFRYGEERFNHRIARAIVKRRALKPFELSGDLAGVIKGAIPAKFHKHNIHPATQSFQALRIHVNGELSAIEILLRQLETLIKFGGKVVFISFHSLEDRLVKQYLARYAQECVCPPEFPKCVCGKRSTFKIITKKPINGSKEYTYNPLARSAKLRAAERV